MDLNPIEIKELIQKILLAPPATTCEESEQIMRSFPTKRKTDPKLFYEHIGHYCWVLLHRIAEEYYTTPQALMLTASQEGFDLWNLLVPAIISEAQDDKEAWGVAEVIVGGILNKTMINMDEKHTA